MAYDLTTTHGYNMYDMSSMLQKAIRRADVKHAAYAATELLGKYRKYLWKRLLTISAEDCYGIMTKEIIALQKADEFVNDRRDANWIFIAKAVTLLCMARKNRDADYVCCNFMCPDRDLDPDEIKEFDIGSASIDKVPDYVYDCHTLVGKKQGKTMFDMIKTEGEALTPHQYNLFDDGDWNQFYQMEKKDGHVSPRVERQYQDFKKDKVSY